ncbi:MAG: hypothetical protein J7647_24510 [Cyanobacteria bacterium SBLK]|nr:hypothetical protein [Cyanobacteria bacterium SBLK]
MNNQIINNLCSKFIKEIDSIIFFYNDITGSLKKQKQNTSTFSELVFYRGYVLLEVFISDYFINCIHQDQTKFFDCKKKEIDKHIKQKFPELDLLFVTYNQPNKLSVEELSLLIDKEEKNITFKPFSKMQDRSKHWLDSQYDEKVNNIPNDTLLVLDAARAIRDCISHQSNSSFKSMNKCISEIPKSTNLQFLNEKIQAKTYIGSYLKKSNNSKRRIEIFMDEFKSFVEQLKIN